MSARSASSYIALWGAACLIAGVLYVRNWSAFAPSRPVYWRFLLTPWKLTTFAVAATGLTLIAPYTRDPTWDYVDASFMAVLTFCTAPWAVGAMYKVRKRELPLAQGFVALCVALFSASWSYDLYLLIRDGYYPVTWWANLFASSLLYLCAGLFWSLDWKPETGLTLAFMERDWPAPAAGPVFAKVLWPALVFMALVSFIILLFLWQQWRR